MRNILIKLACLTIRFLLWMTLKTCRISIKSPEDFDKIFAPSASIIAAWHNRLLLIPYLLSPFTAKRHFVAAVSNSKDGDWLEAFLSQYKNASCVRVVHNQRQSALTRMKESLSKPDLTLIITPDGPQGPLYQVKPGIAWVQKETGVDILLITWHSSRFLRVNSWDGLRIPLPFTTIEVRMHLVPNKPDSTLESVQQDIQEALMSLEKNETFNKKILTNSQKIALHTKESVSN